jgi:hypothetical protein
MRNFTKNKEGVRGFRIGDDFARVPDAASHMVPSRGMCWTTEPRVTSAARPADALARPLLSYGDFGFDQVSVATRRSDRNSLLNWMTSLICYCRKSGVIGAALIGAGASSGRTTPRAPTSCVS